MRRPIHIQLLLPMLGVVVLAITLVSMANAYLGMDRARLAQEENLRRVVTVLSEASFPLTENVLRQMAGLSGAEFVLLDHDGRARHGTLSLDAEDSKRLARVPEAAAEGRFSENSVIHLAGRDYLSDRVPLRPRGLGRRRFAGRAVRQGSLVGGHPAGGLPGACWPARRPSWWRWWSRRCWRTVSSGPSSNCGVRWRRWPTAISGRCDVAGRNDEIRDLAASVNQMAEQLSRYEDEVRRNEQLRTLGQLGAGMAHQLRNAATGAMMAIELHRQECPEDPRPESLEVASRQLKLMESYLQRFLTLGQSRPAVMESLVARLAGRGHARAGPADVPPCSDRPAV